MRHKFYVCEFVNKKFTTPPGKVFVKFGVTHHMDVMNRFNSDINDGYTKNYNDWNIVCKFSIICPTRQHAEQIERYWLECKYPYKSKYKVWVEQVLGIQDKYYYNNSTGITELRLLDKSEAKNVYMMLHRLKKEM